MHFLTVLLIFCLNTGSNDPVFYRSKNVPFQNLAQVPGDFSINDDKGHPADVHLLLDTTTLYTYWYRRLFTEVCLTGECRPIDIGIYWTARGDYLGVEIFRENLTKTDHSDFSDFDYLKLESILREEWSPLREFEFEELVDEKKEGVDATTGATKKVIADASVKDAVYTTYTMWHLIHVGEGEQLALLTYRYLNQNPQLLALSLQQENPDYTSFLIRGVATGQIKSDSILTSLVISSLNHSDAMLKGTAFKAVSSLPLQDETIQNQLANTYSNWPIPDKNLFLQSLAGINLLYPKLYLALSSDLSQPNAWFVSSLVKVLSKSKEQSREVLAKIKEMEKSDNPTLAEAAKEFGVANSAGKKK